jgi:uncharacterized membrane protein YhiD involved in acid resistance
MKSGVWKGKKKRVCLQKPPSNLWGGSLFVLSEFIATSCIACVCSFPTNMTENVNSSQSAQTSTQPAPSASETSRSPLQSNHLAKQSSQSKEKKTVEDESDEILAFTIHIVTPKKQKLTLQVRILSFKPFLFILSLENN